VREGPLVREEKRAVLVVEVPLVEMEPVEKTAPVGKKEIVALVENLADKVHKGAEAL
jgi:hypothetical protein